MFKLIRNYFGNIIIRKEFFKNIYLPYLKSRIKTVIFVFFKNINENYFLLLRNKRAFNRNNILSLRSKNSIPSKDSILFIGSHYKPTDDLTFVEEILKSLYHKTKFRYILIIAKTDGLLSKKLDIPNNVIRIYSNNINYDHEKIKFLPMGINFRGYNSFLLNKNKQLKRDILCYCNFSLNTHPDRDYIYEKIWKKDFITKEHMGKFMNYAISNKEYFNKLKRSKYVICPRGNALDTFRFYDAIYSGAIPIVVKENFHNATFFKKIPILFLSNINEFASLKKDFLNDQYISLSPKIRNYYKDLDFDIFLKSLNEKLNYKV